MIKIGDEVVCVFPGNGTGEDCKVGRRFIVRDINEDDFDCTGTGRSFVFDLHPYNDEYGFHPAAWAWRFAKPDELEAVERSEHKMLIGAKQ